MTVQDCSEQALIGEAVRLTARPAGHILRVLIAGCHPVLRFGRGWRPFWRAVIGSLPLPDSAYENLHVVAAMAALGERPAVLTVVDADGHRLARIGHGDGMHVNLLSADLGLANASELRPLRGSFDIVVAIETLASFDADYKRAAAARNLVLLAAPDGLILETSNALGILPGVSLALRPCIYRRRSGESDEVNSPRLRYLRRSA